MARAAVDFSSAHYLGLEHPSTSLAAWAQLSTGRPAALRDVPAARQVARRLAALQGLEAGVLGPSTLHMMWDLFGSFAREGRPILVAQCAYAISHWGADHARAVGAHVGAFADSDVEGVRRRVRSLPRTRRGPVIVVDGFCPRCGTAAPMSALLEIAGDYGGLVLCDDTQACGVLGHEPMGALPYGRGGAGTAAWVGSRLDGLAVVASLAKGFGVPVAALTGSQHLVDRFIEGSDTRVHCSAPAIPVILAADRALRINEGAGDRLRAMLCRNVRLFRQALAEAGVSLDTNGLFPVQSLGPFDRADAVTLHAALRQRGVTSVLTSAGLGNSARLTFILSARHSTADLYSAARAVAEVLRLLPARHRTARSSSCHRTRNSDL